MDEELAYWVSQFPDLDEDDIEALLEAIELDSQEATVKYDDFKSQKKTRKPPKKIDIDD